MPAISPRRCWWKPRPPTSACSTTRPERRPPAGQQPGAAGALALFRWRRRSEDIDGCSSPEPRLPSLDLGVDAYYKIATDLIDNGNFGQALVLSAFNYAQGINEGVEFSAKFRNGAEALIRF